MKLTQKINNYLFQTDYVIVSYANSHFIVLPVIWFGNGPSIELGEDRKKNKTYVCLPKSGKFGFVVPYKYADPEYPAGYKSWSPITPRITKYYEPVVETSVSTADSAKKDSNSNLFSVTR